MKLLIFLTLFFSCNALKTLTNGETKIDEDFGNFKYDSLYNGLLEFYPFEEASGSTRLGLSGAFPLIDNANITTNSIVHGGSVECTSGSAGGYYLFNGDFSYQLNSSNSFAISFWTNLTATAGGGLLYLDSNSYVFIGEFAGSAGLDVKVVLNSMNFTFSDVLGSINTTRHIVVNISNDGSSSRVVLFVDGVMHTIGDLAQSSVTFNQIGVCSASGGEVYNGSLDSLGLWNRLLEIEEIERLYNSSNDLD